MNKIHFSVFDLIVLKVIALVYYLLYVMGLKFKQSSLEFLIYLD